MQNGDDCFQKVVSIDYYYCCRAGDEDGVDAAVVVVVPIEMRCWKVVQEEHYFHDDSE